MVLFVTWVPDRGLRFIPRMASLAGLTWPLQLKGELLGVPFDFFKSFGYGAPKPDLSTRPFFIFLTTSLLNVGASALLLNPPAAFRRDVHFPLSSL